MTQRVKGAALRALTLIARCRWRRGRLWVRMAVSVQGVFIRDAARALRHGRNPPWPRQSVSRSRLGPTRMAGHPLSGRLGDGRRYWHEEVVVATIDTVFGNCQ